MGMGIMRCALFPVELFRVVWGVLGTDMSGVVDLRFTIQSPGRKGLGKGREGGASA